LARNSSLADAMLALQALGSYPIALAGTKAQKRQYLPRIVAGSAIAAFALTEPQAGSDVLSMRTRALKRRGQWLLRGVKRFISNAGIADTYVVFAVTNPRQKATGISAFVVPADSPGLVLKEKTTLISPHPIGTIAFEDCPVSETQLLGHEGEGLRIAFATLDVLRCTVGAAALGLAQRALEEAIAYSQKRRQFGRPLAHFQGIQWKLADMATELEAARLLVYQAAWMNDHGREGFKEKASMAKLFATETAQKIVDQALQIHGGVGLISGTTVEQLYRDVRSLRIYEGTSEMQRLIIARSLIEKSDGRKVGKLPSL
jgi:acyl-CoA dehydrogenase